MAKYSNKVLLKQIGNDIKQLREKKEYEIEDIAFMTGFKANTIRNIEKGIETTLSYFIEVCFALNTHPSKVLNLPFNVKPRFELSQTRKEKNRITSRLTILLKNGFFDKYTTTKEISNELESKYGISIPTKSLSVILIRMEQFKLLKSKTEKRHKVYVKV